jgi:hypothetical protein
MHRSELRQITLLLSPFLRENVGLVGVLSLDLARAGEFESLLGAGLGLHFWHRSAFIINLFLYFFFELITIVILLPCSVGICSTTPTSSSSCANFNRRISPLSLNTIVRPLKNT